MRRQNKSRSAIVDWPWYYSWSRLICCQPCTVKCLKVKSTVSAMISVRFISLSDVWQFFFSNWKVLLSCHSVTGLSVTMLFCSHFSINSCHFCFQMICLYVVLNLYHIIWQVKRTGSHFFVTEPNCTSLTSRCHSGKKEVLVTSSWWDITPSVSFVVMKNSLCVCMKYVMKKKSPNVSSSCAMLCSVLEISSQKYTGVSS